MSYLRLRGVSFALAAVVACSHNGGVEPPDVESSLIVTADLSGTAVATVVLAVSAPDLPTPQLFNIPIVNSVASGTITLRAGASRTITMHAYDAGGIETHTGSVTIDVHAGSQATISLVLQPLTGDVPIQVTLGSFSVTVTQPPNSVGIGETVQLTASVKDWNGNPVNATVAWATSDPSIASVDSTGLAVGIGAGNATIAATCRGAMGTTTVTVEP